MEHVLQSVKLLGRKVRDKVTGLQGAVTSVCFDLYGCTQAIVHPGLDKDGKPAESHWYDVTRLEVLGDKPVMANPHLVPVEQRDPLDHGPAEKPAPSRA